MHIQCEKCRTIFKLDESLLKEDGSRVRCSLCGHVFMAYPPAGTEAKFADTLVVTGDEKGAHAWADTEKSEPAEAEDLYEDGLFDGVLDLEEEGETRPGIEDRGQGREAGGKRDAQAPARGVQADTGPKIRGSRPRWPAVVLVFLLILAAGAAALVYWKPALMTPYLTFFKAPEKKEPADPGVRLLRFESVAGSFVVSEKGGELFVIRGQVQSQYPTPRSHILVKGNILDRNGKVATSRVAYAGNTFTDEELKTLPLEEILQAMENQDGMARQNFNVPSGARIPFMIVFHNLPENLSEFTVEAVSSSPGA